MTPPLPDSRRLVTVLGATGTTGSRVAAMLRRRSQPVRAVSRRTEPRFDWTDAATWAAVLGGTRDLYLVPPEPPGTVDDFVTAAIDARVERIVLLSARGPDQSGDTHLLDAEAMVTAHAPRWTVIRPSWFAQNFSDGFFRPALDAGELGLPTGDGREPFIDADDIAEVAVAALTDDRHHERHYELSGPQALSFADAVDQLASATGGRWRFVPVSADQFAAEQSGFGTSAETIAALSNLFAAIRNGANDYVSDGVEAALGRPPTPFHEFAARAAVTWRRPTPPPDGPESVTSSP